MKRNPSFQRYLLASKRISKLRTTIIRKKRNRITGILRNPRKWRSLIQGEYCKMLARNKNSETT